MHAAAEDAAVARINADDAAGFITAILPAAFTPPAGGRNTCAPSADRSRAG